MMHSTENKTVSAIARRIHGWSWQAFPIGMGTGAVYVTLSGLKQHHHVLTRVEIGFFFLNIALFLFNSSTLLLQAIIFPRQALRLVQHPVKGIFVPLIVSGLALLPLPLQASTGRKVLSFATIVIGTINYAVPAGHVSPNMVYGLFWVYISFSLVMCFPMLMIWFNKPHDLNEFTPACAFLIFPLMLVGVVAYNVLRVLDPHDTRALGVLLTGYFFQGLGFFMSFFYITIYVLRIISTGFLEGHQANGAFIACGPPGFTALALINLGDKARAVLAAHEIVSPLAGEIWYACGVMSGLLLFGLAVFFFFFGVMPYWFKVHKHLDEILGCWALTFPNVGWIATLRVLGDTFHIPAFYTIHLIMAIIMCLTWLVLFILTAVAFWKGLILHSKDEDVMIDSQASSLRSVLRMKPAGSPASTPEMSPHRHRSMA